MGQGVEIKKIKDICDKASSNIVQNKITELEGVYPVFGASGFVQNVDFYHRDTDYIGVVKDGSGVGRVNVYPAYSSLLGTLQYILPKEGYALNYVAYALKSLNLAEYASGAAIPHIYFKDYGEETIPVPPREEQERIVAELDCLSGIIEKKREQLKELDALAESIFYTMFGDPITNEKGWEVKKLGEVASEIFAGGDKPKDFSDIQTDEYLYPIYANGEGDRGLLGYSKTYRVESKAVALGARGASIGNCRICEGKFTPVVRLITIIPSNKIDIIYLFYSVRTMSFNISGAGQAQLTTPNVINKSITIPPLSLQQKFADKIEAIEKQKELIKQSITETETLFNARMDYYFN